MSQADRTTLELIALQFHLYICTKKWNTCLRCIAAKEAEKLLRDWEVLNGTPV